MKVILFQDIPSVGRKYDIKDVADGYARNFLMPRKLAVVATAKEIEQLKTTLAAREGNKNLQEDLLLKNIAALDGETITLSAKANEKGHLFAKIDQEKIAEAIKEQKKLEIPLEHIILEAPIKEVGEYQMSIKFKNLNPQFKIIISAGE